MQGICSAPSSRGADQTASRLPAAQRSLRRCFRRRPERTQPARARGRPPRRRPRAAAGRGSGGPAHALGQDRARPGAARRRCRTAFIASLERTNASWCWSGAACCRSNNSWMHNLDVLVKGKESCTLHLHPTTPRGSGSRTARLRGDLARGHRRAAGGGDRGDHAGRGEAFPHGWGHDEPAPPWRLPLPTPAPTAISLPTRPRSIRCRGTPS